ncbi:MAG: AbrB/MazE/SpoVT family DNA-binding domain-containing protein [Dehalococcoidia bacterium]|nr:AbrB/MazE/SpoVT family DNA-binding domain-containing protein [Dehalococcoidia bacterium]
MRLRIQKWGNSLALRIPKPFAEEARVEQGSIVDLSVIEGKLVAAAVSRQEWTLAQLLAGVTPTNLHGESDFGPPAGREVW